MRPASTHGARGGIWGSRPATGERLAVNYRAVRCPAIYPTASVPLPRNVALASVKTRLSALSGTRDIVEAIFFPIHRETDITEKLLARMYVTEEFPLLVKRMSPCN